MPRRQINYHRRLNLSVTVFMLCVVPILGFLLLCVFMMSHWKTPHMEVSVTEVCVHHLACSFMGVCLNVEDLS